MKNARLVGGLAASAVLLILLTAAPALATGLPLVSSTTYATAANDGYTCVATAGSGVVYAAGHAKKNGSGSVSRLLLVKYLDDGSTLSRAWHRLAGGRRPMSAVKLAVDASGNVIVAGNRGSTTAFHGNGSDIVVLKFSAGGDLFWSSSYDGPAHGLDYVKALALDEQGNAIVCGASFGGRTGRDYVTLKVTADGRRAWARRYAGPSDFDEARDVTVDAAGNVYVTGQSRAKAAVPNVSGPPRAVTISYSPAGRQRWLRRDLRGFMTTGSTVNYCGVKGARGVLFSGARSWTRSGGAILYIQKLETDGRVDWGWNFDPGPHNGYWPVAAALDGGGAPVVAGTLDSEGGVKAFLTGVSATGEEHWGSAFSSAFTNPARAEFASVAAGADGRILAAGLTASGDMAEMGGLPTTFLVRYSPGSPADAPLDYVGEGTATTHDACTAVAIGDRGMYAVGHAAEGDGDSDAVLLKF